MLSWIWPRTSAAIAAGFVATALPGCSIKSSEAMTEEGRAIHPESAMRIVKQQTRQDSVEGDAIKRRSTSRSEPVSDPRARPVAEPRSCPAEMAAFGEVCIDRYEAHLVVRQPNGSVKPHPAYERPPRNERFEARAAAGVLPQAYINRTEAASACQNAEKRLCSLDEWYDACRGPADTTYPYGAHYEEGRCNVAQPHILSKLHGKDPKGWTYDDFNDPRLIQEGYLSPAGAHQGCKGELGIYDMVGNLHEWVGDPADPSLSQKLPLRPGLRRALRRNVGNGVFMGGFFSTMNQHGKGCEFVTTYHEPRYHDYSTGFRCCKDR